MKRTARTDDTAYHLHINEGEMDQILWNFNRNIVLLLPDFSLEVQTFICTAVTKVKQTAISEDFDRVSPVLGYVVYSLCFKLSEIVILLGPKLSKLMGGSSNLLTVKCTPNVYHIK